MSSGQLYPHKFVDATEVQNTNGLIMKKHRILSTLFICFSLITFFLAGFIGFLALTHTKGYSVQSNSMAPEFGAGSVVFVRSVQAEDLREGNIVTVQSTNGSMAFTHRIARIDREKSLVYTKGDNNPSEDPMPADMSLVVGRVWFSLPLLGTVSAVMQSRMFPVTLAIIAMMLVATRFILTMIKKHRKGGGKDAA